MLNYIAAGLNLVGGISDYYAARSQAAMQRAQGTIDKAIGDSNAVSILEQGLYNSTVIRNNGVAKANDKLYQNSIISANKKFLLQQTELSRDSALDKIRALSAKALTENPNLSADVIRSIELEEFDKVALQDAEVAAQLQSMDAQMTENERTSKLDKLYSSVEAEMALAASRNDSFYSRLNGQNAMFSANMRSKQTKRKSTSNLLGSFSQSISMVSDSISNAGTPS